MMIGMDSSKKRVRQFVNSHGETKRMGEKERWEERENEPSMKRRKKESVWKKPDT